MIGIWKEQIAAGQNPAIILAAAVRHVDELVRLPDAVTKATVMLDDELRIVSVEDAIKMTREFIQQVGNA